MNMNNKQKQTNDDTEITDFHGAALIDEEGNETPITEGMVQNACSEQKESDDNKNKN